MQVKCMTKHQYTRTVVINRAKLYNINFTVEFNNDTLVIPKKFKFYNELTEQLNDVLQLPLLDTCIRNVMKPKNILQDFSF